MSIETPIKGLIERDAQLLRRTDVSKADVCGRARPRLSRRVLLTDRGLKRLHMRKATESPLRFASVCFPHASPAFVPEAGKQKKTPKDPSQSLIYLKKIGAGDGLRTLDPDLGKISDVAGSLGNDRLLGTSVIRPNSIPRYPSLPALVDFPFPCLSSKRKS